MTLEFGAKNQTYPKNPGTGGSPADADSVATRKPGTSDLPIGPGRFSRPKIQTHSKKPSTGGITADTDDTTAENYPENKRLFLITKSWDWGQRRKKDGWSGRQCHGCEVVATGEEVAAGERRLQQRCTWCDGYCKIWVGRVAVPEIDSASRRCCDHPGVADEGWGGSSDGGNQMQVPTKGCGGRQRWWQHQREERPTVAASVVGRQQHLRSDTEKESQVEQRKNAGGGGGGVLRNDCVGFKRQIRVATTEVGGDNDGKGGASMSSLVEAQEMTAVGEEDVGDESNADGGSG
ncbi:hypothetical protein BHM03_00012404 [Ensete ventricosum]|nr:hypothetical protein BHM03_00012404 [Ensete ventricosum]